jgi:hypothetical protein
VRRADNLSSFICRFSRNSGSLVPVFTSSRCYAVPPIIYIRRAQLPCCPTLSSWLNGFLVEPFPEPTRRPHSVCGLQCGNYIFKIPSGGCFQIAVSACGYGDPPGSLYDDQLSIGFLRWGRIHTGRYGECSLICWFVFHTTGQSVFAVMYLCWFRCNCINAVKWAQARLFVLCQNCIMSFCIIPQLLLFLNC